MTRQRRSLSLLAILLSFVLIAAACGDDGDATPTDDPTEDPTPDPSEDPTEDPTVDPTEDPVELTASFKGVTEDTINIGVTMLDFPLLVELNLSPAGWGDQEAVYQAIIDSINEDGGINGRQINPEYRFYSPVSATSADEVCTELTQDYEIFAVIGGFLGPAGGTSDPCITGLNDTILVGGEQNAEELRDSTAPWYTPAQTVEGQTAALLSLLVQEGYAEDAAVFVVGNANSQAEFDSSIAALEERDINVVGSAILGANDSDTIAQDTEMVPITENIKGSGADTVFIFGNASAIIRGLANANLTGTLDIWNNNAAGLGNLGESITDRSVADGTLTVTGLSDEEIWALPLFQSYCADPVIERVPDADLRSPDSYELEEENWFNSTRLACQDLFTFDVIASAASVDLTQDSFVEGANSLGSFDDPTGGEASLSEGKINTRDFFRLSIYDSTFGDGGPKPLTDLANVNG